MGADLKEAIISKVKAFPAMPAAAAQLMDLMGKEETNASEIEAVVRYDPGMTANVLKIANSAYFGLPRSVDSLSQAIVRLGLKRMRQIIVAAAVNGLMEGPVKGYGLPGGELWRHALASTVAAEAIAEEHEVQAPDQLFTAALLHDAGKLVMSDYVAPFYHGIEALTSRGAAFNEAEREVLGADHAEVGALIMAHWNFPDALVDAVRYHHTPEEADVSTELTDLVHLADLACMYMGIGVGRDGAQYRPSLAAAARLGFQAERVQAIGEKVLAGLEQLSLAFSCEPSGAR
jgi:putative nucleotidyltransferase with HDIG domain